MAYVRKHDMLYSNSQQIIIKAILLVTSHFVQHYKRENAIQIVDKYIKNTKHIAKQLFSQYLLRCCVVLLANLRPVARLWQTILMISDFAEHAFPLLFSGFEFHMISAVFRLVVLFGK